MLWQSREKLSEMSYILGIDVGTTSVKVVLLETNSKTVCASQTLATESDITDSNGIRVSMLR